MRLAKLTVLCLALFGATSFFHSSAQSGRSPSPQPTSKFQVGNKTTEPNTEKYKVVFSLDGSVRSFIDQLNLQSEEGYRLKSAVYAFQHFSGTYYSVPVAILQSSQTQFEYASFEVTSIPDFEPKYAEQSKKGFRLVDHFLTSVACKEDNPDSIPTAAECKSTYLFLLEREKGSSGPRDFVVAETALTWNRQPVGSLASMIMDKLANGFYPARVLSNSQLLLAHAETGDFEREAPEVQVVTSSFLNNVKKKIKTLGRQGFRLSLIGEECALMSRRRNEREPVVYEWLNAKNKNFERELSRIKARGAIYRMLYRDPWGGNQLVFELQANGGTRSYEYKALKLSFQLLDRQVLNDKKEADVHLDLTPEAKETVKLINDLARQGFVVRDLFISNVVPKSVGVLLERSK